MAGKKKARKAGTRRKITPMVPPMVALLGDSSVGLLQHEALEAFAEQRASEDHFDTLLDCRAILLLAATHKQDEGVLAVCDVAGMALDNVRDIYNAEQRIVATEVELQAFTILVQVSEDFWSRTSGLLFEAATHALATARQQQRQARESAEAASAAAAG